MLLGPAMGRFGRVPSIAAVGDVPFMPSVAAAGEPLFARPSLPVLGAMAAPLSPVPTGAPTPLEPGELARGIGSPMPALPSLHAPSRAAAMAAAAQAV